MCLDLANKISLEEDLTVYKVLRIASEFENLTVYTAPYHKYFEYEPNETYHSHVSSDEISDRIEIALHSLETLADSQTLANRLSQQTNAVYVIAQCTIPKDASEVYKGVFITHQFFTTITHDVDSVEFINSNSAPSYASDKLRVNEVYPEVYKSGVKYDTIQEMKKSLYG